MTNRGRIADFWDQHIAGWLAGEDAIPEPLRDWSDAYNGHGKGMVELQHYPDPFVGDLRGDTHNPRIVLLGLNPGVGFDQLQSRHGLWAKRVAELGYSQCFARSPAEDPVGWLAARGKTSRYWDNAIRFAQRWLGDPSAGVHDILNLELYPWHSKSKTAAMQVPASIAKEFVFDPVAEIDTEFVFAFGADWFQVAGRLGLPKVARYSPSDFQSVSMGGKWQLGIYRLGRAQKLVVSSQSGYAGPPGEVRLEYMRSLLKAA